MAKIGIPVKEGIVLGREESEEQERRAPFVFVRNFRAGPFSWIIAPLILCGGVLVVSVVAVLGFLGLLLSLVLGALSRLLPGKRG